MYAEVEDKFGNKREIRTNPLTNYNIIVLDQTLKNNSSVSVINTNVTRSGSDYDANVSAALFNFNNKKNTYNWNGKFARSELMFGHNDNSVGYSHNIGFGKTGGRLNFQIGQEIADQNYDINDMGILFNNNFIDHYFWTGYRWLKPGKWYNNIQINYNAYYSRLFTELPGQKINSKFQSFSTNINANAQLKNLWFVGMFFGYVPRGNDFYEPRYTGYSFRTPRRIQINPWFETNSAKKYSVSFNYFLGLRSLFNSPNHQLNFFHRYRFSDKLSVSQSINFNPTTNDAGYYDPVIYVNGVRTSLVAPGDVVFTRRNLKTIENVFSIKYNFNNKSGITFRARHYWSKVEQLELYDLLDDGTLKHSKYSGSFQLQHQNFDIFNVDAMYTWQFAPGSFINIVWKEEGELFNENPRLGYFRNLDRTLQEPQSNNLSVKIIYYLDYLNLRKKR